VSVVTLRRADALKIARAHLIALGDRVVREEFYQAGYEPQDRPILSWDGYLTDGATHERAELPEPVLDGSEYDFAKLRAQCKAWIDADEDVLGML
jgi:hypothetical protein